jgi:hypothetical protein
VDDLMDRRLAYAYMLARGEGSPLVYGADLRYAEVKAGISFHRRCAGQPFEAVAASRVALAFRRGSCALAALNKGGAVWTVTARLRPGLYRDLTTGWEGSTVGGEIRWRVPGRSAALLCRVD